jgi:hypothetical protein
MGKRHVNDLRRSSIEIGIGLYEGSSFSNELCLLFKLSPVKVKEKLRCYSRIAFFIHDCELFCPRSTINITSGKEKELGCEVQEGLLTGLILALVDIDHG